MSFLKEFREFAIKGNVVDLAIAVVLGAAFGKIVTAITESLIMPLISLIVGKASFKEIAFVVGQTVFPIGTLLQAIFDFVLIALVLFLLIRGINRLHRKDEVVVVEVPAPTESEILLREIRDELRRQTNNDLHKNP